MKRRKNFNELCLEEIAIGGQGGSASHLVDLGPTCPSYGFTVSEIDTIRKNTPASTLINLCL